MTGSVTSKSTVSPTCALEEETLRLRRRRTGVPSWSVSTWAAAARTRKKVQARRMMKLSEANQHAGCQSFGHGDLGTTRHSEICCRATRLLGELAAGDEDYASLR